MIDDAPPPAVPEAAAPCWIGTAAELDRWLDQYPDRPLALDTEFERVTTFFPIAGLVQLGQGDSLCLVEPAVAAGSAGFRAVLTDPQRPKLLYAMGEDLDLFRHWLALEPQGLLDLQIGAALAGAGFSVGYARLVEEIFGETLDKSATRSDWLARPLTEAQQRYALDDIRFLEPLFVWQLERLELRQLTDALVEESERFADEQRINAAPEQWYLRLRGGWHLGPRQQSVLQALVCWREQECRRRDRPRNRILSDAVLIAVAEKMPDSLSHLSAVEDMPTVVVRRHGDDLLDCIARGRGRELPADELIERPLSRPQQDRYRKIKKLLNRVAENADVPIELLAPRRRLEALIREGNVSGRAGTLFSEGWRGRLTDSVINEIRAILTP